MPCIPSYHEQMWDQANLGLRVARQELAKLMPLLRRAVGVVNEALEAAPDLRELAVAKTWHAKAASLLERAAVPDVVPESPSEAQIEARKVESEQWRALWREVEEHVCEAGTLAWRAKELVGEEQRATRGWKQLLDHHVAHREADRKAKLAELRARARALRKPGAGSSDAFTDDATSREAAARDARREHRAAMKPAIAAVEAEISRLESLSEDELCANREALREAPSATKPEAQKVEATKSKRERRLAELNARHAVVLARASSLRDRARERVHASGAFFDEVTAREDAIMDEGGPELAALLREERELEAEIARVFRSTDAAFEREG